MFLTHAPIRCLALTIACVVLSVPAAAVIIASGDGTGNTSPPADDPGWKYVGFRGGLSAVYLGNGWVVTANHVSEGDVILDGVTYPVVAGSKIRIADGTGTLGDLAVFQIDPFPAWPLLRMSTVTNISGDSVVMIGHGRDRGDATTACTPPRDGFLWGTGGTKRWGENVVTGYETALNTAAFYTTFNDRNALTHEAQAAAGDSGGATFVDNGGIWELAGVMFAIAGFSCQPSSSALYENLTYSSDLAAYRDQIIPIVRPQCSDEIDNDGDLLTDFPDDPDCSSELDDSEESIESAICGNSIIESGEDCDDGNTASGDCCSGSCLFESVGSSCDDGDACSETDTCDGAGSCLAGSPLNCDDGLFCNGAESCDSGLGCQSGTAPTSDDGVACTDDSCDEVNDVIVNTTNDANCDDGLFCNGAETCDAVNDCQSGTAPTSDDGVTCTDDSCDETNDSVDNIANDLLCDDQDPCTADSCDEVFGCGNEPIVDCSVESVPATQFKGRIVLVVLMLAGAATAFQRKRSTHAIV